MAVALELGSCVAFVVIFRRFFDELPRGTASELAWTEQGAGALLPGGGVGALAIGGWLLRRERISTRQVIERSSALFFLTSAVNVAALVGVSALLVVRVGAGPHDLLHAGVPILGGLAVTAAVLVGAVVMRRAPRSGRRGWLVDLVAGIDGAERSLLRPSSRLIGAPGYLGLDIAALGATFAATGHPLPIAALTPRVHDRLPREPDPDPRRLRCARRWPRRRADRVRRPCHAGRGRSPRRLSPPAWTSRAGRGGITRSSVAIRYQLVLLRHSASDRAPRRVHAPRDLRVGRCLGEEQHR
ncbi:MAG: hypothetical protein ACTHQQ_10200 [Solirubrobacteraceae bacterium]